MKTLYITLSILIFALLINSTASLSQVDINKKINMTGGINDDRRITNVGDVTAAADAVNAQTLQKGSLIYIPTVGGSANAITASTTPSFTPQAGSTITFKAASANTGSVTLNVNGAGAFPVYKNNTEQLILNDIKSGQIITATFDGNNWQIGGGDNLGNHQATQNITANANNAYDIGNATNGFKDGYFTGVIKLDNATFLSNDGSTNTFVGETQNTSNSGGNNTFVGYRAGSANTTGDYNTFLGYGNGQSNTTGGYNTFVGAQAGLSANMSYSNFVGYQTGLINTGGYNDFMGYQAGYSSTYGWQNQFMGYQAGYTNTGSSSQMIGYQAGYNSSSSSFNTFMGYQAGYNTNGSFNQIIGYAAGTYSTSGAYNVLLGTQAGYNTGSASYNCFIGLNAGSNNTTSYNVALGASANSSGNSTFSLFLGYSSNGASGITNSAAIGSGSYISTNNTMAFGSTTVTSWVFGRTSSVAGVALIVGSNSSNGNGAYLTNGGVWQSVSDRNKKENFK